MADPTPRAHAHALPGGRFHFPSPSLRARLRGGSTLEHAKKHFVLATRSRCRQRQAANMEALAKATADGGAAAVGCGCMFNVVQRRCQDSTDSEGVTTRVNYCAKDDATCENCVVSASKPVCYGANSQCVCSSLCSSSAVKPSSLCVSDIPVTSVWLTFGGFALLLPLLLYMHRKWNEPHGVQHMIHNRRRRRLQKKKDAQRDSTRDLTLSEWRSHCEQFKLDMDNIELKTCYLKLHDHHKASDSVTVDERSEGSALPSPIGCGFSWNSAARVVSLPPAAVAPHESPSSSYSRHNPAELTEETSAAVSEYEEIALDIGSHTHPEDRDHGSAQAGPSRS